MKENKTKSRDIDLHIHVFDYTSCGLWNNTQYITWRRTGYLCLRRNIPVHTCILGQINFFSLEICNLYAVILLFWSSYLTVAY